MYYLHNDKPSLRFKIASAVAIAVAVGINAYAYTHLYKMEHSFPQSK